MYCPRLHYLPVLCTVQGFGTYQFYVLPKTSLLTSFMYCPRLRYLPVLCTTHGFATYQFYVLSKASLLTSFMYCPRLRYLLLLGTDFVTYRYLVLPKSSLYYLDQYLQSMLYDVQHGIVLYYDTVMHLVFLECGFAAVKVMTIIRIL